VSVIRIGAKLPSSGVVDGRLLGELAKEAEESGFDAVWVSDHVVMPQEIASRYPFSADGTMTWQPEAPWIDALVAMATAAAATDAIAVGVGVLIIPMRNPVVLAKQLATLDFLSRGRLVVGVGAGWLREEFEALQAPFETRGAVLDEWIEILRDFWTGRPRARPTGHYPIPAGLLSYPAPVTPVPILIGGMSAAALRRVAVTGDGWFALQQADEIDPAVIAAGVDHIRTRAEEAGREPPLRVALRTPGSTDVLATRLAELVRAGVTDIVVDVDWDGDGARRTVEGLRSALP